MRERKRPAHGVYMDADGPIIVYDTICARDRLPWLANDTCHRMLIDAWTRANARLVGHYVIMPDYVHLFAATKRKTGTDSLFGGLKSVSVPAFRGAMDIDYRSWVKYWKRLFTFAHGHDAWRFQDDHWDRRLRSNESYAQKWDYLRQNPVRKGLVSNPDAWPYQGELNELHWL